MASRVCVACAEAGCVQLFHLDPEHGGFRLLQTLELGPRPMPMCVAADGRTLYVALRAQPWHVVALHIDARSGLLARAGAAPLAASMAHLALDPSGRFLLGAAYAEGVLGVTPLAADGLPGAPCCELPLGPGAHHLRFAADGRTVFASVLGEDRLARLHFDSQGGQLAVQASLALPKGCGPRHFALHPRLPVLYVLGELDGHLYRVCWADGAVQQVATVTGALAAGEAPSAAELLLSADGSRLYATERRSHRVHAFAVSAADGALQALAHWAAPACPRAATLCGDGLLVAGLDAHRLALFAADASGRLLAECATAAAPAWICAWPA